jgi:amino acid adenylation domain-containing protein
MMKTLQDRPDASDFSPRIEEDEVFAFPLSFAQQRLWVLDRLEPNSSVYNIPIPLRLKGPLNVPALRNSLSAILRRHEVLHATFAEQDDAPVQIVAPPKPISLRFTDVCELPFEQREEKARQLAREDARTPFDLTRGPLFRAWLLKLAEQDHVLLLNAHHIVFDGWSRGVLVQELLSHYAALAADVSPALPDLPIQYSDFAIWQREHLAGERLATQIEHWRQQLAGAPASLDLPLDYPRPPLQTFSGAQYLVVAPCSVLDELHQLSRREGATLFMTLLAAFNVLLARYSGQEDIVVGSPIAGRNRAELEKLIGFFVSMLPLRTDLSGNPAFRELLRRVKEACLKAYAHQDVPFEKLIEELKPDRDTSRNPVFQVMFALQNMPTEESSSSAGLSVQRFTAGEGTTAKFELSLYAIERPDGLRLVFEYNTDLFTRNTIERMAAQFQNLLEGIAADASRPIAELPWLSPAERQQVLVDFNRTEMEYPRDLCLHDVFQQQAERTPDAIALMFGDTHLSYYELNRRSNQLAHHLQHCGIGVESRVGIYVERSAEMLVAILGVLKAGAAYIPLDPAYPRERIAFIVEDSQVAALLTQERLLAQLPPHSARVICLDSDWPSIAAEESHTLTSQTKPENLAYVLYTSGSTGKPKGVQIRHRNLVSFLSAMQQEPGLAPDDVLLAVTTLSFDIAGLELFLPLTVGARIVLATREQAVDGAQLLHLLHQAGITVMQATPATWRLLLEAGWAGNRNLKVLCGGEALPRELAQQLLPRCREVWNMYGPTETTIWSSAFRVKDTNWSTAPIGRPIANTRMYVLDKNRQPVPVGVPGELYIGGDGVARGYWNRPELTAEKFVTDPFCSQPGERLYSTGDQARLLPDGNLQYLGRLDTQVKVRGYRIELGEVEDVLAKHPAALQAVVVVREDIPGDKRLVAYLITKPEIELPVSEWRSYLRRSLPEYMIPSDFVHLKQLPLTPNGKVDRRALPAPDADRATSEFVAARTPTEKLLSGIWSEVLRVPKVSIFDNFFELGGHSLLATQVISRIQKHWQRDVPLRLLFEHTTIAELARALDASNEPSAQAATIVPHRRVTGEDTAFPLSFSQQRLWVLDRLEPNTSVYNLPMAMMLKGKLDSEALNRTLSAIVQRHEVLRAQFRLNRGEPEQVIRPAMPLSIPVVDLSALPEDDRKAEAKRQVQKEAQRPFDLANDLLFRASLLKISDDEHVLLVTVHHIVFDGWSRAVLLRELTALYNAFSNDQPPPLPELPIQYTDFAAFQREYLSGERLAKQLEYWKRELGGAPTSLDLATDFPRPPLQTFDGAEVSTLLPPSLSEALRKLSRQQGTTMFMTLLAAFNVLLARYSGQEDIVVGSPIAGRNRAELENLVGFFVNTLALRVQLDGNPTFQELLARVRRATLAAYAHQDLPFEKLVEELKPERDLSRNPIFQVMFALQNVPNDREEISGLTISGFRGAEITTAKFDLQITLADRSEGLFASFIYNTKLFQASTIQRMQQNFRILLEGIAEDASRPIAELPLLSEPERKQLLADFNRSEADFRRNVCLHQFFEEQVERTPAAVALVVGQERLSYEQLNRRANQVAHHLLKRGAAPEMLIGIYVERSVDMVVGLLGILKTGAAYVPLDPAYPKDRIACIMEDAHLGLLLTQQRLVESLPPHSAQVILLDGDASALTGESEQNPACTAVAENLAYVLFTSGSTGRPKGVALEHRSVSTFVQWAQTVFSADELAGTLLSTSICFDLSVFELFVPLSAGGKVIVAQNALYLPTLSAAKEVTLINTVPSAIAELLRMKGIPDSVSTINLAGEALPSPLVWELYEKTRVQKVYNLYGPTEDTTYSTYTLVRNGAEVTIGRPLANTQAYILDRQRQPVPLGVPGELYLAGEGLARGYFGRPELTAERFVPNPFSDQPAARMYRTGDLCRYLPDGNIQYIGRIDNQVKLRGFRIELGEIESALFKHPGVEKALVVVREDVPGDKHLVAYLICKPGNSPANPEWRSYLKQTLPDYMIPSDFVGLDQFPLTPNGKIDRRALPPPEFTAETHTVAPARDELEAMLVSIWKRVLGVPSVGITDNFFELGGHSLLAVRLMSEIKAVTGRDIPLASLFQGATVEFLAELIRQGGTPRHQMVLPIQEQGTELPFFGIVTPGMNALGLIALARHLGPDQPFYRIQGPGNRMKGRSYSRTEFETLAAEYVKAMKTVQPQGPYYFGGMCEGARIAFDMARLLERQGEEVGLLAIFDTFVMENSQIRFLWKIDYYWGRLKRVNAMSLERKWNYVKGWFRRRVKPAGRPTATGGVSWPTMFWPGKDFVPPKFGRKITVFKNPKQPFFYVRDPLMGWGTRTTVGVELHVVNSTHGFFMREPYVQELAKTLSECLRRARTPISDLRNCSRDDETGSTRLVLSGEEVSS